MKKSNIILLSLLAILLLTIITFQFQAKLFVKSIDEQEIVLPIDSFNGIQAENGWYIELYNDSTIKVTVKSDSIKNLISVNQNILTLKAPENELKHRMSIKIYNQDIKQLNISGNTIIYNYIDSIDTLNVSLKGESRCILTSKESRRNQEQKNVKRNKINFLNIITSDKSSIDINSDLNEIQGELNDSSYCHLPGSVKINNFVKSENAKLNSW